MAHHILMYDYVENVLERRAPYRADHLAHIRAWQADGRIVLAGAVGDPPHGAVLVFDADDAGAVERFVADDPYVSAGLVTRRRIEPLAVVQ